MEDLTVWISDVTNMLNSVPEDAFSLGMPITEVECVLDLEAERVDKFNVQLRYGEGKVQMVFDERCECTYTKTGGKVWLIEYEGLNQLFAQYTGDYSIPDYLQQPLDVHSWRKNADAADMRLTWVYMILPQRYNFGYDLSLSQIEALLDRLKQLPDSAFVPATFSEDILALESAGMIRILPRYPERMDPAEQIAAVLEYVDGHLYFSFEGEERLQTWEILDEDFLAWQASLYDETASPGFHVAEKPTGSVSVSHGNASIQLNTYEYMEYEIIEYSDEKTPFGIRMKPKMLDEGWVSVMYYPGGFTPTPEWTDSQKGSLGDHKVIWYYSDSQSKYIGKSYSAVLYLDLSGDYAVVQEGLDIWQREYYYDFQGLFDGMVLDGWRE